MKLDLIMTRTITTELIRFVFVTLFLYTGLTKIASYEIFLSQIGKSVLLHKLADQLAWAVPVLELGTALSLMAPRTRQAGFYASFGLMTLFTFYVAATLLLEPELPCSCGGIIELLDWHEHLIVNVVLVGLSAVAIAFKHKGISSTKPTRA